MDTSATNEVQTRNPLFSISSKQKKRLNRISSRSSGLDASNDGSSSLRSSKKAGRESLERPLDPAIPNSWASSPASSHASSPLPSNPSSPPLNACSSPPPSNPSSTTTSPSGSAILGSSSSPTTSSPGTASLRLNKASSWMTRLAASAERARSSSDAPLSPRSPRWQDQARANGGATSPTSVSFLPVGGTLSPFKSPPASPRVDAAGGQDASGPPTSPSGSRILSRDAPEKNSDEEEEKRKKRFFNNLIFFKDVESVKGSSPIMVGYADPSMNDGTLTRKEAKRKAMQDGKKNDEDGFESRPKGLRKATSGRQVTESLLKATRNLSAGASPSNPPKGGKKRRSDVIEEMAAAERAYILRLNMLLTVKWYFGRYMLAIHDEVHLRPVLENILNQFNSYLKMHTDFLGELHEKLKQAWDNAVTPIGDLLIDKMGFLQCYCDYYNENTQQWQKIEDAARTSYAFALFLQEMERKPELESNSVKSLFLSPIKHLAGYVTLLKDLMEVTSIHHPDYAATRKAYFQAKVIVGSMQKESLLLP